MFRGNVQHTGVYDAPGVPELHGVRWKFKTRGRVYSSPAVAGGVVFVGSTDGNLYAIDAATGAERWKFATQGRVVSSPACRPVSCTSRATTRISTRSTPRAAG
jgi:outer membrane protein assembly factor BamB